MIAVANERDKDNLTLSDLAKMIITSKERAEDFIARYIKYHNTDRKGALSRLKDFGIDLSTLPDK